MARVKLELRGLTVPEKIQKLRQIAQALSGNPRFAKPDPTPDALNAAATALEAAYNAAQAARDTAQTRTRAQETAEAAADKIVSQAGNYVENASGGDPAAIQSAGLDVRAEAAAPVGELPAPEHVSATMGDEPGEMDFACDRVRGARTYLAERCDDLQKADWTHAGAATQSKMSVRGLTSGQRYFFRMSAVGAAGQGPWSEAVSKMAP